MEQLQNNASHCKGVNTSQQHLEYIISSKQNLEKCVCKGQGWRGWVLTGRMQLQLKMFRARHKKTGLLAARIQYQTKTWHCSFPTIPGAGLLRLNFKEDAAIKFKMSSNGIFLKIMFFTLNICLKCFLCYVLNKIWVNEICKPFANHHSVFYLYFTQCYTELDMYKHACKCAHMQRQPDKNRI